MKIIVLLSALCLAAATHAQITTDGPMYQEHQSAADQHAAGVDMRSDHAMGFSHENTTHHFTLLPDGGIIEVDINAGHDDATRDQIRMHLAHIAAMFSADNFEVPMFIHGKVPQGVPTMKEKHETISYTFEPIERGARVRIKTQDPVAVKAIHEFLTFQI